MVSFLPYRSCYALLDSSPLFEAGNHHHDGLVLLHFSWLACTKANSICTFITPCSYHCFYYIKYSEQSKIFIPTKIIAFRITSPAPWRHYTAACHLQEADNQTIRVHSDSMLLSHPAAVCRSPRCTCTMNKKMNCLLL